jgi:hypothetical protein
LDICVGVVTFASQRLDAKDWKSIRPIYRGDPGVALAGMLENLRLERLDRDTFGCGQYLAFSEPTWIVVLTDGGSFLAGNFLNIPGSVAAAAKLVCEIG